MRAALDTIAEELRYLKRRGVDRVYIADGTLEALREAVPAEAHTLSQPSLTEEQVVDLSSPPPSVRKAVVPSADVDVTIPEPKPFDLPDGDKMAQWSWLRDKVLSCPECNKHVKPGKKVVFGVGNIDADIFFCGEAPGADEEIQGEPFVGKAGQLLTKIIQAMGFKRDDVYISNIMNWRPEMPTPYGNRPPTQREMEFCLPYLKAQVAVVQPKVIVALGATAVNGLLGYDAKRRMKDTRGQWFSFENTPLMVTFHPSYLLRNSTNKAKRQVWEDILKVMERVELPISDKQRNYFL
tara:strand:- start:2683 stop:3567 length:885 start_codon:yes stop_codon:yes gene_type:complete